MPIIRTKMVMDQTTGPQGHVSCGVHSFKNMLLTLLLDNNSITPARYNSLLSDPAFFNVIFDKFLALNLAVGDVLTSEFANAADQIRSEIENDRLDLTSYGISNDALRRINLTQDSQSKFSVGTFLGVAGEPELGTMAGETDLLTAGAIAKFSRTQGTGTHIFAIGDRKFDINGHWVTVIARKQDNGTYEWDTLDSWHNEALFARGVINKIEPILNKSELELKVYLRTAYDSRLNQFHTFYDNFFDANGQLIVDGMIDLYDNGTLLQNAHQHFIEMDQTREPYFSKIKEAYTFFESANWLENPGEEELVRLRKIRAVANYMYQNADPVTQHAMRTELEPIVERLDRTIAAHASMSVVSETVVDTPFANNLAANIEAIDAVNNCKPTITTPNIFARLVESITHLLEGIKLAITSMVDYVATAIGVKS